MVPYPGGEVKVPFGGMRGAVVGAEAYVADWIARDGLADALAVITDLPSDTLLTHRAASTGTPAVDFYRVAGAGHTWPGGWQYLPRLFVGSTTQTFDASDVIVDFLDHVTR